MTSHSILIMDAINGNVPVHEARNEKAILISSGALDPSMRYCDPVTSDEIYASSLISSR